jgi:glycine cleavage system H protein
MTQTPAELFYTSEHEWLRISESEATVGITDHAQEALTDIVYIELPEVGEQCEEHQEVAIVESVKSASPIFSPLAGEIIAVNEDLEDAPEKINESPYGEGWIFKMKLADAENTAGLLSAEAYQALIA